MQITMPVSEAINLAAAEIAHFETTLVPQKEVELAAAKEKFITENQAKAWFNKSREYWEHAWEHGEFIGRKHYSDTYTDLYVHEEWLEKLNRLLNKLEGIEISTNTKQVTLQDKEISLLGLKK